MPATERQQLFIKKLRLCSRSMDFSESSDMRDKEIKRLNLLELMDYINNTKGVFNDVPLIIGSMAQVGTPWTCEIYKRVPLHQQSSQALSFQVHRTQAAGNFWCRAHGRRV